jgi:hypothetical protein
MIWRGFRLSHLICCVVSASLVLAVVMSEGTLLQWVGAQGKTFNPWPDRFEKEPSYTIPPRGAYPGRRAPQDDYRLGPMQEVEAFETEHRLYRSPFRYKNVVIDNWVEFSEKGVEIQAERGSITIREQQPIVSVTVVGTGCETPGYNIVEWWDDGEDVSNFRGQLIKRQRVGDLRGQHPQQLHQLFTRKQNFKTVEEANEYVEILQRALYAKSFNFTVPGSIMGGLYENTAYFRIGDVTTFEEKATQNDGAIHRNATGRSEAHKVVIRAGSLDIEEPGKKRVEGAAAHTYYPGDYAVRLIDLVVRKKK